MTYENPIPAIFCARPNRFVAHVLVDNQPVICHVKNTGRCRELLIPGVTVWLQKGQNPNRKTPYDLIAVQKGDRLINMDSQAPNKAFSEWAKQGYFTENLTLIRPEVKFHASRFDFYWESKTRRGFVEVKGVTLEEGGITRFPDAPTLRGVRHMEELLLAKKDGFDAAICFVIQMSNVSHFEPNAKTHPAFGDTLRRAKEEGVDILALDCAVTPGSLTIGKSVPIRL